MPPLTRQTLVSLAPIVGNRGIQRLLMQRCGAASGSRCGCHGEPAVLLRSPDAPTVAPVGTAPPLAPVCDLPPPEVYPTLEKQWKPPTKKGEPQPVKPEVDPAKIAWIEQIPDSTLPERLGEQIDLQFSDDAYRHKLEAKLEACIKKETKLLRKKHRKNQAGLTAALAEMDQRIALSRQRIDELVQAFADHTKAGRERYRMDFILTMSCLFADGDSPDDLLKGESAAKQHFMNIVKADAPGDVWLHKDAAARFEKVRKEMQASPVEGDVPDTTIAQSLRHRHLTPESKGKMSHPLGLAIDFRALAAPHVNKPDTVRLLMMVTKGRGYVRMMKPGGKEEYEWGGRTSFIEKMGKWASQESTATTEEESNFTEFLNQAEASFKEVAEISDALRVDPETLPAERKKDLLLLPKEKRDQLEKLKTDYLDLMPQIYAAQSALKKAKKDAMKKAEAETKLGELTVKKQELQSRLPKIFEPWLARIKADWLDYKEAAAAEGITKVESLPDEKGINKVEKKLGQIAAVEKSEKDPARREKKVKPMWKAIELDLAKIDEAFPAGAGKTAVERLAGFKRLRHYRWMRDDEVPQWQKLYDRLSGDLAYVLGVVEKKKTRSRGEFWWLRPGGAGGKEIPVAQLLEAPKERETKYGIKHVGGLLTDEQTKDGFTKIFFRTMVKYGFDPGASWGEAGYGRPDSMHFDFVEGLGKVRRLPKGKGCSPYGVQSIPKGD